MTHMKLQKNGDARSPQSQFFTRSRRNVSVFGGGEHRDSASQGRLENFLSAPGFHRRRLRRGGGGAFEEGEKIGVDGGGFRGGHAVGEIFVGFQDGAFHEFGA